MVQKTVCASILVLILIFVAMARAAGENGQFVFRVKYDFVTNEKLESQKKYNGTVRPIDGASCAIEIRERYGGEILATIPAMCLQMQRGQTEYADVDVEYFDDGKGFMIRFEATNNSTDMIEIAVAAWYFGIMPQK